MSQKSSRRARRDAAELARRSVLNTGPLSVSIVTSPNSDFEKLLSSDLELIRSSILYADSIDLISVGATLMRAIEALRAGGVGGMFRLMAALDDEALEHVGARDIDPTWRQYIPMLQDVDSLEEALAGLPIDVPGSVIQGLRDAVSAITVPAAQLEEVASDLLAKTGMNELWPAVRRRVVNLKNAAADTPIDIEDLAWIFRPTSGLADTLTNWQARLGELLNDRNQRLLLDEVVSGVVREMQESGLATVGRRTERLASEANVGTGLIARLPAFPGIPVDELLSLREDLTAPLGRYRFAVQRLAVKLQSTSFASDRDEDIEDLWVSDVAPTIMEIEDLLTDHGLIREFGRSLNTESRLLVINGSALITTVATVGTVQSAVAAASAMVGSTIYAGLTGSSSAGSKRKDARRNDLYYLVEINRRLSAG